jgi:uncharacterized protein
MSQENVHIVRGVYEAFTRGDIPAVLNAFDPHIEWREADNFPYADRNPYIGPQAILEGVFIRVGTEWKGFSVLPDALLDAGEQVVGLGLYSGTYKATGKQVRAQFAHIWTLEGGKVRKFQQYTDTKQFAEAVRG